MLLSVYVGAGLNIPVWLPADRAMAEGFFTDTLDTDTSVVTSGAQLLLSEEFRFQIKNENKD